MRRSKRYRFLKWIGMPPVLRADGFGVYNWKYENRRAFPVMLPKHGGRTNRILEAGPYTLKSGETLRLGRSYTWTQDAEYPFVCAVHVDDVGVIEAIAHGEFIDVTDMDKRLWNGIRNAPVIEGNSVRGKALVKDHEKFRLLR